MRTWTTWAARHDSEQPGCIHANMDLYRWAYTSMPWIGSDVLWACFALAVELRVLDMEAGPYDLRELGYHFQSTYHHGCGNPPAYLIAAPAKGLFESFVQ